MKVCKLYIKNPNECDNSVEDVQKTQLLKN